MAATQSLARRALRLLALGVAGFVALIVVGLGFMALGGRAPSLSPMDQIHARVADDAVAQYRITKSGNDPIDICVHAGLVAASYLQAQDQVNYLTWKQTEKADCAAAGIAK